jgi:hypothetical protein
MEAIDRWLKPIEAHLTGLRTDGSEDTRYSNVDIDTAAAYQLVQDLRELYGVTDGTFNRQNLKLGVAATCQTGFPLPFPNDGSDFKRATNIARLARAYFLLIAALAPCLPAIIHVDVASRHYAGTGGTEWKAGARESMSKWSKRIETFRTFVRRYRRVLENSKFRLDLMALAHMKNGGGDDDVSANSLADFGVRLTLVPDVSFNTLGVRGLLNFDSWGENPAPLREKWIELLEQPSPGCEKHKAPLHFTGELATLNAKLEEWKTAQRAALPPTMDLTIFQDAWSNLRATEDFVSQLLTHIEQ